VSADRVGLRLESTSASLVHTFFLPHVYNAGKQALNNQASCHFEN
jgi:hypothetical protein